MAPEKLASKGQAWFCTTGLPSDVIVEVEDMAFHLHKFPLMSRSGKLDRLIKEQETSREEESGVREDKEEAEEECYLLTLPGFPGGSEAFEVAAKFCYGVKVDLTPTNVAPLRCAAEYLEMTEDHSDGNLVAKTEAFLNQTALRSVRDAIKALSSCEQLLPLAEDLGIVCRCIDAIAAKVGVDPSASPVSSVGNILWNGIETGACPRVSARSDGWYDELTVLGLPFYKRVVSTMKEINVCAEIIEGSLICYVKKFIPGLSRRNRVPASHSVSVVTEDEQRDLLETVVSHMSVRKSSNSSPVTTTRLIFGLLRTANILSASEPCRTTLERKIASQLDQATLDDLLLPSYCYLIETLYDIDCVERILGYFLEGFGGDEQEEGDNEQEERRSGNSPAMNPMIVVGKLMDGYLAEIASDGNLKLEKFYNLAISLPDSARVYDDGLYRAIDVYLKAHPWISEDERDNLCSLMDCQKLTLEACTHAAQNERLPLRVVVQVLFFEQLQLRNAIAVSFVAPDTASIPDSGQPSRLQDHIGFLNPTSPAGQLWQTTFRNNQVLRLDMDSMRARVHELERECTTMRRTIRKFNKSSKNAENGNGGGSGGGDEIGGNGGWSSFTKKFGCKFKTQVCDSHERTWVEAKRGSHHQRSSSIM